MQLEVIRSVADWLGDATYGVNAQIDLLDLDGADAAPTDVAAILDETRSTIVALRRIPSDQATPFLLVYMPGDAEVSPVNQGKQDIDTFPVVVAYVDKDSNAGNAVRDASYVMRAVRRSLNVFHQNANAASRTRNGVEIRNGNIRMQLTWPTLELEGAVIVCGLRLLYAVRDNDPD